MGSMSSWILLLLAGVLAGGPGAAGAKDMTTSDICLDDGLSLQCSFDHVVHIQTVTCGDGSYACASEVKSTLARLCEGRSSCAGLGLRDLFSVQCSSPVPRTRRLVVTFTCQPDSGPAPACRTNLCSDHSRGLRCSEGSVLHVRNVTCLGGLEPCSWATYVTLYSLCESRAECDSSGLRMLMPAYCNNSAPQVRNVFVDYLCVPKELLHTQCEGEYQTLDKPFGLLMNPAFGGRPGGANAQCSWLLSPGEPSRKIIVTVHVAHSKWGTPNCSNTFLRVRYKDCDTQLFTTQHFCDLRQVNTPLTSCGPVEVSSWLPAASDQADRFLVSYQIVEKDTKESTPGNMSRCSTPLVTPPPTSTTRQTTRAVQTGRNYGPAATMFDYSDTIRHTGDDASRTDDNYKPVTLQFKLLVLYVFFGVVIIALVIALVYVLVSYRGISRHKRSRGDSSEKAALWRRDETPLDTFNHNSHNSLAELSVISPTTAAACPDTCNNHVISSLPDSQVVATVHAQSGDEEEDHRLSTGSGFSSFLSGRDSAFWSSTNPYANVGHIDIDAIAGKDRASPALRADDDKGNIVEGLEQGTHRKPEE
ncbi:uncharacterized protein LOC112565111 [Pomacea canaliculata]|uniref:uncharacterized protein LOC112565111 n=1 Tax=Pomacea canaliculata TaxID=400727 RepID=UPI000D729589|nr:uncharacterized protein LOC112565111 [Pomacea canaliculata]